MGGDEFVVLLTNSNKALASSIVERFRFDLEKQSDRFGLNYTIDFSSGLVQFDIIDHANIEGLIKAAYRDMYKDKNQQCNSQ